MSDSSSTDSNPEPEFDAFAGNYDEALQQGLDLTGESKEYFAQHRVQFMKQRLRTMEAKTERILDFGCGTGGSTSYLLNHFELEILIGTDVSADSLAIAQSEHQSDPCRFVPLDQFHADQEVDFAFCNGVFHHIPLDERQPCFDRIFAALRPGGVFCYWENNPWNPGTRWVMKRVPFDRDAIMLWPNESRNHLRTSGFEIVETDYLFLFPNLLKWLRFLEPFFVRLPLGGQYMVLARRPAVGSKVETIPPSPV